MTVTQWVLSLVIAQEVILSISATTPNREKTKTIPHYVNKTITRYINKTIYIYKYVNATSQKTIQSSKNDDDNDGEQEEGFKVGTDEDDEDDRDNDVELELNNDDCGDGD